MSYITYNQTDLRQMGFSPRMIKLLPEPERVKNQHGRFMYLWSLETVYAFMETETFKSYQEQRQRRSSAAKKIAEKKTKENVERVRQTTKITVTKRDYDIDTLLNWGKGLHDAGMGFSSSRVVLELAIQIWLQNIEIDRPDFSGAVGKTEILETLHQMIAQELSEVYPQLAPFFHEIAEHPGRYFPPYC